MTLLLLPSLLRAGVASAGVAAPLADVLLLLTILCADSASASSTAASTQNSAANAIAAQSLASDCAPSVAACALQGRIVQLVKRRFSWPGPGMESVCMWSDARQVAGQNAAVCVGTWLALLPGHYVGIMQRQSSWPVLGLLKAGRSGTSKVGSQTTSSLSRRSSHVSSSCRYAIGTRSTPSSSHCASKLSHGFTVSGCPHA